MSNGHLQNSKDMYVQTVFSVLTEAALNKSTCYVEATDVYSYFFSIKIFGDFPKIG